MLQSCIAHTPTPARQRILAQCVPITSVSCCFTGPWYVAAASGAKRLVLVLDVSGSMGSASQVGSRLNTAIQAAVSVIETLTSADYAQVVLFSTDATSQGTNLLQVTADNQQLLLNYVTSLSGGGSTNYIAAFDRVYSIFRNSRTSELGASACRSVVLFLTDGRPNDSTGTTVQNGLTNFMAEVDTNNEELTVFTYSLGPDADTSTDLRAVPQALACIGRGVWAPITSNVNLRSSMVQYYTFLANGLQRDEPVWVEPYFDATGLGTTVTTASKAVYDKTVSPPEFLGVVGVDVVLDEFNQLASNSEALLNALVSRSQVCTVSNITDCDLQRLRANWPCPAPAPATSSCPSTGSTSCSIALPTASVDPRCPGTFLGSDETQYRELQCCELLSADSDDGSGVGAGVVIGIVAGVAVFVVIVAAVVYKGKTSKSAPPKSAAPAPAPAPVHVSSPPAAAPAASNLSYYNNAGANTSTAPYAAQNGPAYPATGGGYPPAGAYPGSPPGPAYGGGNPSYPPAAGQPASTGYV